MGSSRLRVEYRAQRARVFLGRARALHLPVADLHNTVLSRVYSYSYTRARTRNPRTCHLYIID